MRRSQTAATARAFPARRADVRTTAECSQSALESSYRRRLLSTFLTEIWSRLISRNQDRRRPRQIRLAKLFPKAPPRQKFQWHICKRKTRHKNEEYADTRDRAADRARNFLRSKPQAICDTQT